MKAAKKDVAGGLQPQAALAAGGAPNGYAAPTGGNAAPPLTRHRYFPSEELRRATRAKSEKIEKLRTQLDEARASRP